MPANTYIKARKFAALAVGALERDTVLPNIVTRYDANGFVGALNDTVTAKLPGVTVARDYEWRTRTAPIVLDSIGRTSVDIKLDTHVYNAIPITDEELTLDIESFGEEVVVPQVNAIGERLDSKVMAALRAAPFKVTNLAASGSGATPTNAYNWAVGLSAQMTANGCPATGRVLLVGANPWAWLMQSPQLVTMDPNQATSAFREAVMGRIAGFDVITSALVTANEIFAVHPSWAVLANLAPDVPEGVTYGARRTYKGYSLRVVRDYDPNYARDRSFINTFVGISSVNDEYLRDGAGALTLDVNGNPQLTTKNVRGSRGTFTP